MAIENAKKMINDGTLSFEKIAEYSGLSLEMVRELAGNKSAWLTNATNLNTWKPCEMQGFLNLLDE